MNRIWVGGIQKVKNRPNMKGILRISSINKPYKLESK